MIRRSKASDFDWLGRRAAPPEQISANTCVKRPCSKACRDKSRGPCSCNEQAPPFSCPAAWDGRHAYHVSANRLGDILDAMAAERMVIEIELIPDLLVDSAGDANGAGSGESLKASCDVDAITEDVATIDDHVAEIDADPQFEAPIRREEVVDGAGR